MNIGLIGCGRVAEIHMLAYKQMAEAKVAAASDINMERARNFARMHGIMKVSSDYLEILEMKDLDYVDVCTPVTTHLRIACEAARLGQNVLLEKPMARSTTDCDEIIRNFSKSRTKLCICHNQLFIPQVMQAKGLVDSGKLDLLYFRVSVRESAEIIGAPSWITTNETGGILWETGCHSAYLQLEFLKNINEVCAIGKKINHPVHDHFSVLLRAANQALGLMDISWLSRTGEVIFELIGSNGKKLQILNYNYLLEFPDQAPRSFVRGFYLDQKMVIKKWLNSLVDNLRNRRLSCLPHYLLIRNYMQSIVDDSEPPVKPEDGRKTIQLLECIEESLNKDQPVRLKST